MTTYVTFHKAATGPGYAVINGSSMVSSTIAESASNQQSAASTRQFATVRSTVAIWVATGTAPDATVTTGRHYQAAGEAVTYGISEGDKVAVITA
jgi:hypothetical protein